MRIVAIFAVMAMFLTVGIIAGVSYLMAAGLPEWLAWLLPTSVGALVCKLVADIIPLSWG